MADFLNNLYSNPNFAMYLIIAIIVLVIVFVLVLLLGKKDKKLEETKRLEKINQDTFKETSEPVKLESSEEKVPEPMTDILLQPQPSEMHYDDNKEEVFKATNNNFVEPAKMETDEEPTPIVMPEPPKMETPINNDENNNSILSSQEETPIKIEEPIKVVEDPEPIKLEPLQTRTNTEVIRLVNDEDEIKIPEPTEVKPIEINPELIPDKEEEPTNAIPEVKIPEFNFDELEATLDKQYNNNDNNVEKDPEPIDLNSLLKEDNKEEENNSFAFADQDMPKLKDETEIKPVEFDTISGESYNINK
jgi:hypothetical protein